MGNVFVDGLDARTVELLVLKNTLTLLKITFNAPDETSRVYTKLPTPSRPSSDMPLVFLLQLSSLQPFRLMKFG